jgi:uncharacterized membrane protein YjgN (DUF898 family)
MNPGPLSHAPYAPVFCTRCGTAAHPGASFCMACGAQLGPNLYRFAFFGQTRTYYAIWLKTIALTIVTLGIYNFWGRVELRRYLYNQTEFLGDRFVFHGTGTELLVGWLKAFGVLAVLFALLLGSQKILPPELAFLGVLVFYGVLAIVVPLALFGTWGYRASRSSWRNLRFSFFGDLGQFYKEFFKAVGLVMITLGFGMPFFYTRIRSYLVNHSTYGTGRFTYWGNGGDLMGAFLGSMFLTLPTLWFSQLWFKARLEIYHWEHTAFEGARFRFPVRPLDYALFLLGMNLVALFTLGLALPWVQLKKARYVSERLMLEGHLSLDHIQKNAIAASATGEGFTSLLDLQGAGF